MVQRILDHRLGGEHDAAARGIGSQPCRMDEDIALAGVSCSGSAGIGRPGAIFHGLAGASGFRRVLEAVVHRGSLRADPGAGAEFCRVV